jgi:multiple sugar transport system substrate-binding protein
LGNRFPKKGEHVRSRIAAGAGIALVSALLVTGCSGTSGGSGGSGGSASGPVHLTLWDWDPNMNKVVALWNKSHPDIQVNMSNPAGGDQLVSKLITDHAAHNDPDLTKVEYQSLPALVSGGVVADITQYTTDTVKDYDATTLSQVKFQGKVYGVPQDFAPLMLYYRTDIFSSYGLAVPTTWAQYASEAATLRQKAPGVYMTNFDAADPGWFSGLAQQAGANWWTSSGNTWKVAINDAPSKQVADYWQQLVQAGSVATGPSFSPQWNKQMNTGALATWISGAWAPAQIGGIAPATKGKWAVAPLPQWSAGQNSTGIWGGAATTVTTDSQHPQQAAEFASWLNTNADALTSQVNNINIYPAATSGRSLPVLATAPPFFPNQANFYDLVKQSAPHARTFQIWGPDVTVTFASYTDSFDAALQSGSSFDNALTSMQNATVADMKKTGFTVSS